MSRLYSVIFENVAVTAAQDLFELTPADDKPIAIHAIYLSNLTEIGDAMEEMLRLEIIRGFTASGTGGTAPTPVPLDPISAAAGCVTEVNNTTLATTGTSVILHAEGWNIRVPYQLIFTPELRPCASQANTTILVRLMAAPADSVTMSGTLYFEEYP